MYVYILYILIKFILFVLAFFKTRHMAAYIAQRLLNKDDSFKVGCWIYKSFTFFILF